MARTRVIGEIMRDSNYEVSIKKPLDARSLVKTYDDLLNKDNWLNAAGKPIAYNGMVVSVVNTVDASKNGLYYLFDAACTTNLKSPDTTNANNWFWLSNASRVRDLELQINSINSKFTALEVTANNNASEIIAIKALAAEHKAEFDDVVLAIANNKTAIAKNKEDIISINNLLSNRESDEIAVDENGSLKIKEVNVNKLVQNDGESLILTSGDAK